MEILEVVLETLLRVLRDPIWQGVGVITGLLLALAHIFPEKAKLFVSASAIIVIMGFIVQFLRGNDIETPVTSVPIATLLHLLKIFLRQQIKVPLYSLLLLQYRPLIL